MRIRPGSAKCESRTKHHDVRLHRRRFPLLRIALYRLPTLLITAELTKIFSKYNTTGTWYAHASVGCLHVRSVLDMKQANDVAMMRALRRHCPRPEIWRPTGDGIVRSEFNEVMFAENGRLFREVTAVRPGKHI